MLRLHHSHRLEELAATLAATIREMPDDPFRAEWVVVHGRPMEQWLRAQLARRLGICAHVRFLSPTTLLEELVEHALGVDRDTARAWRGERLAWAVLGALGDRRVVDHPSAASLRRYLADCEPGSARAVQLARLVAEHFQRYGLARPELARLWSGAAEDERDDWQPLVWRAAAERLGGAPPLAALLDRTRERVATEGVPDAIPRRVSWLAQGGIAALHVDALALLADAGTDVHLLVPSSRVDAATPPRHPLLGSLARHEAGIASLLASATRESVKTLHAPPVQDAPSTILARLQRDLVADVPRGPLGVPPEPVASVDGSIRVHVCHGAARQADVLRDELLRLFDAHPDLMPRDVLVLTPDVASFAPLVASAFAAVPNAAPDAPPAIPLRVVDRPLRVENPVADAAIRLLMLACGRADAVEVLDFVALPCVRARFAVDEEDLRQIRQWVAESGVRWGIDATHRGAVGVPAEPEHTWRFGLDRLLLGWALPGEPLFGGALPYDEVEGQQAELLGCLAEACERAFGHARALQSARTLDAWCEALGHAVATLVDDGRETTAARLSFDAELRAMRESAAGCDVALDLAAFRVLLDARFAEPATTHNEGAGAVTLATLALGRVTPARVVCLIGMDDGAFPRARRTGGFDRIAAAPRAGDGDANAEDRQSFLDAILAARDVLVVTYAGRTCDTNERVAPAVPVAELLDALDATFAFPDAGDGVRDARSRLEIEHPLQPFSPRAFGTAEASFDPVHLAGARALRGERTPPPAFLSRALDDDGAATPRVVAVDALAGFFANPARALLAERLRVSTRVEDPLETREPALLDALEAHGLRERVLQVALGGAALDGDVRERLRAAGMLPHAASGALAFDDAQREARRIARAARVLLDAGSAPALAIDHVLDRWRLVGRFASRRADGGLLVVQPGAPRARQLVAFWVRHLALSLACETAVTSTLVGLPGADGSGGTCELGPVEDPAAALRVLLALFDEGRQAPLAFFPETSRELAHALKPGTEHDAEARRGAIGRAARTFAPAFVVGVPESADAAVQRFFPDLSVLDDARFVDTALAVWRPLTACLKTT